MTFTKKFKIAVLLSVWIAFAPTAAFAAISNAGILDNVLTRYSTVASTWSAEITTHATWLFWTLALISMIWSNGMLLLRKADAGEFLAEFLRFTIFTGFFWWLLVNGPRYSVSIMDSLRQIGARASGLPNNLAPSGIVDIGFDIFFKVLDQSSVWSPVDSACGIIIGIAILVVFALVGVNMLLLLISGWVLAYAGVFFLGFGGSRWTSDMAIGYFKTVLNIAGQLFAMVLLVGIGKSFVDQYYISMSAGITLKELGVMLVVAAILLALVKTIPGLIGGLAGGNVGALGSGFGAGAAMAAASMGAAALATGGAALVTGAANAAGGAQALMAAVSKANSSASASTDMGTEGQMGVGEVSGVSGKSGGGAAVSSFAAAMGDSGASSSTAPDMSAAQATSEAGGMPESGNDVPLGTDSAQTENKSGHNGQNTEDTAATESSTAESSKSEGTMSAAGALAAKMGKVAAGTAANLVQGSWDVGKAKYGSLKDSAFERISNTPGGKIAAAIKAREAAAKAGSDSTAFDENSLSAGSDTADADSEVAAFRDRGSKPT